jgi:hypothetical protein
VSKNYTLTNGTTYPLTGGISKKDITNTGGTVTPKTYDGTPGVTVTGQTFDFPLANKELETGTDYTVSASCDNADAGDAKTVTVTVTLNATAKTDNYNLTGRPYTLTGVITRAVPTVDDLTYDLTSVVGNGQPQSVTVISTVSGVGAVTVKYDGVANPPAEPGTYTVTVDIAESTNYAAVTGLELGTFTIYTPPILRHRITLRPAPGLTTTPSDGTYYVTAGANFVFRLTLDVPSADGTPPQVQTSRTGIPDGSSDFRITSDADGSYTVVVFAVNQDIEITLSTPTDNAPVAAGDLTLGTAPGTLVIANSRPDAATLRVYTPAGTLVRLTTVPPGTTRLSVPPGIYIVSVGGAFRRTAAVAR